MGVSAPVVGRPKRSSWPLTILTVGALLQRMDTESLSIANYACKGIPTDTAFYVTIATWRLANGVTVRMDKLIKSLDRLIARLIKEGEGGPGAGALAPIDPWVGSDVHVDIPGGNRRNRRRQGIAVAPSVHKAPPYSHVVSQIMENLWGVPDFVFKNDTWPPATPAPTGGGGSGPAAAASSLAPANMDVRHTGSPPKGVSWQKLPRQGGTAVGGAGAGAIEAGRTYVEKPADAPKGTQTHRGPRGGIYYETAGDGERESGVFYHGTNRRAAALMEQQGFGTEERIGGMAPGAPLEERGLTFLTPSKRAAHWFAHENFNAPKFGGPAVIKINFDGRVLRIPKATSIYDAAQALGVKFLPARRRASGVVGSQGYSFKDFRRKLAAAGYDAVAFSDKHAGGREALAVFNTASLRFGGPLTKAAVEESCEECYT